ncbi:hypothetical protein [Bradyrhizobium sp. USDA 10063]
MSKLIRPATHFFPQAYCIFCAEKTPHRHERLAVNGKQEARAVCLTCKKERATNESSKELAEIGGLGSD